MGVFDGGVRCVGGDPAEPDAGVLGASDVSIEQMVRHGREASSTAPVQVVMLTHDAREANVRHALREIQMLTGIVEPSRAIRIEAR